MKEETKSKIYHRLGNICDFSSAVGWLASGVTMDYDIAKVAFATAGLHQSLETGQRLHEKDAKGGPSYDSDLLNETMFHNRFHKILPIVGGASLAKAGYDLIRGEAVDLYDLGIGAALLGDYLGDYFRAKYTKILEDGKNKEPLSKTYN